MREFFLCNIGYFFSHISFFPKQKSIIAKLDKTQVIRIVTNLVKNATQSLEEVENKELEVTVDEDNGNRCIIIADNGKGISEVDGDREGAVHTILAFPI